MMMMIPEAYDGREDMSDEVRGFYAFHGCLTEPWDGPASISFTDGTVIGATLDRNGLRPGRWMETKDGWVVLASETGVLDEPPENVLRKGRLQPGHLFLVDLARGRIVEDEEIKREIAGRRPYGKWFDEGVVHLGDLPAAPAACPARGAAPVAPAGVRLQRGGHEGDPCAAREERRGADRLDGQRPGARGPLRPARRSSTATSSSSSPRSRIPRSTRRARRS